MRGILPLALCLLLLAGPTTARAADESEDHASTSTKFAPEQGNPVIGFRGDFGLIWAITDGQGMSDHALLNLTFGPQFGDAVPRKAPALSPVVSGGFGVAEDGEFSMRIGGGLEVLGGLVTNVELVGQVLGGYMRQFHNDLRAGPFFKVAVGVRLLAKDHFWLQFEPVTLLVLPPPPGGFTRYTSHVAVDVALIRFGGRTR